MTYRTTSTNGAGQNGGQGNVRSTTFGGGLSRENFVATGPLTDGGWAPLAPDIALSMQLGPMPR